MKDLNTLGVAELSTRECESVNGGSDFTWAAGYTAGLMIFHLDQAVANAADYYANQLGG